MTSTTAFELEDSEHHNTDKSVIIVSKVSELCSFFEQVQSVQNVIFNPFLEVKLNT